MGGQSPAVRWLLALGALASVEFLQWLAGPIHQPLVRLGQPLVRLCQPLVRLVAGPVVP
jgi:hypothetical protein